MTIISNRFLSILIGVFLVIIGLFIPNSIIGIVICLLLAAVVFYDEKVALLFLIVFVPIRPFLIVYNSGFKFIADILIFFLLLKVIYNQRNNIRNLFRFNLLEISYILFLVVGILSALLTGVSMIAIIMQVRAFLVFFLLYYIVKRLNIGEKDIRDFALTTFITAVVLSIHGLVEKISVRTLLLPELWANMNLSPTNKVRIYGLISGPNELALYLLIAFLVSFYLLAITKGKPKIFIYIGMTLMLSVFLLTYSRGAVLAVAAFLIAYIIVNRKIHHFKSVIILVAASMITFFAVASLTDYMDKHVIVEKAPSETDGEKSTGKGKNGGLNRFKEALSEENIELSNADGRVYYVKKAIEVFKDKPIMGHGFATFGGSATQTYSSPIYKDYEIAWNFYSDNQYIQLLAETGIIGVALVALFIYCIFRMTWALRKGTIISPLLLFFLFGGVTSAVVYNILENDVFMLYYFIVLGYAYQLLENRKSNSIN
ncbi:O-antigen ligase family protein [Neobacillus niacini]|uniref:O-antigen ligase family protein n=1 Tax=Neobacillus niacini TaxID=86668 RepID=UPI0020405CE4|nr:O-antigen ligase family protein [Neobacillus niacini]MCM3691763.1 O-antigen ligase family protein [Neobacillus niacini]